MAWIIFQLFYQLLFANKENEFLYLDEFTQELLVEFF